MSRKEAWVQNTSESPKWGCFDQMEVLDELSPQKKFTFFWNSEDFGAPHESRWDNFGMFFFDFGFDISDVLTCK